MKLQLLPVVLTLLVFPHVTGNYAMAKDTEKTANQPQKNDGDKIQDIIQPKESRALMEIKKLDRLGLEYFNRMKGRADEVNPRAKVSVYKVTRTRGAASLDSAFVLAVQSLAYKAETGDTSVDCHFEETYVSHKVSLLDKSGKKLWVKKYDWLSGAYMDVTIYQVSKNAITTIISLPDTAWNAWERGDFPETMVVIDKYGKSIIQHYSDCPPLGPVMSENGRFVGFGKRIPTVEWKIRWTIHDLHKKDSISIISNSNVLFLSDDGLINTREMGAGSKRFYYDSLKSSKEGIDK